MIYGGVNIEYVCNPDVFMYNPSSNEWRKLLLSGTHPIARHSHVAHPIKEGAFIVVFGGVTQSTIDDYKSLNDVYVLDLENSHWINLIIGGEVPTPIYCSTNCSYTY